MKIDWSKVSLSSKFIYGGIDARAITISRGPEEYGGFQVQIIPKVWIDYYENKGPHPYPEIPYASTGNTYTKYVDEMDVKIVEY